MAISPPPAQKPAVAERNLLTRAISWLNGNCATPKRLRVLETVTLGDKRLVAVIQADGQRFLIGGGPAGVSLLTPLDQSRNKFDQFENSPRLAELAG
jgi:flagellar biogenesis protein FliO